VNAIDKKTASLTAKLLAINVPMVSIVLFALFSVLELQYYRTERAELVRSLHSLVDLQSSAFAGDAWEYDTDHIAVLLDELADLPQLQSAVVLDDSAAVLGRIGDADAKPEAPDLMVEQPLVYKTDQSSVTVGALVVTFHSGVIWKNVENHIKVNALTLVVLLATLIGVTLIAVRVVIAKPIGRLLNSIERMRSDHVLELVDWQSADELGRVVDAYNEMQTKQAEAEAALIEHQNHLEAEVAARTADLAAKEAQLRIAMDNMPGGMFMIDAEGNFALVNQQYQELFDFPDGIVGEGCTLHDAVRFRAERGDYGPDDPEDLIERRLRGYGDRDGLRHEERLPGGKIVELIRRPAEDGSTVGIATDITERKRAEDALVAAENRLSYLLKSSPAVIYSFRATGDYAPTFISENVKNFLGYEPAEYLQDAKFWRRCVHPDDLSRVEAEISRLFEVDQLVCEYRFLHKNGIYCWVNDELQLIRDSQGEPVEVVGSWNDVTARKQAEQELAEKEAQLRVALDNMPGGMMLDDRDLNYVLFNSQYSELNEFPDGLVRVGGAYRDELRYQAERGDFGPGDKDDLVEQAVATYQRGEAVNYEREITGSGRTLQVYVAPTPDGGTVTIATDITARKQVERDLSEKEALLRLALDSMPGGLAVNDSDFNYVVVNDWIRDYFGVPDGLMEAGRPMEGLLRYLASQGVYGPGDVDDLVKERFEILRNTGAIDEELTMPDGRILQLQRQPLEDGGSAVIFVDITERKRAEDALEEIKERFTLATEAANVGLWDVNVLTGKSYYSDKWMTMLGYEPNELPRSMETWENLLHPEDKLRAKTTFDSNVADNDPSTIYQTEFRMRAKDGSYRWISSAGSIIEQDDEGCARRLAGIHVDVTDRKIAEEELREARDAAESATVAKAAFLATMSHEIRTPMNGVVGMVDLLRQTKLDDDQHQMTRTIRDSAHALLTVINDILDFSKIEAGKLDLEGVPISVRDALEGVAETLAPTARGKGIGLKIYVDPDLPDAVLGDQVRIRQFLFNLGGNAIKFTEAGQVLMRVDLVELHGETTGERTATMCFRIIDSGIGISEDARANLFKAFSQAESSTTRRFGGTGLGLTICQRLTDLMGGSIDVESELGRGSTFSITLTLPVPEDHAIKSDGHDLEGLKVLLLGDDAELGELHARYLRHWNAEVTTCGVIERVRPWAIEAAKEGTPFKVIVLGSGWPLETQAAHVGAIKAVEALAGTRFVLMTRTRIKAERKDIADTVYVESDPLRRAAFIHGVAIAAGRASPDISYDEEEIVVETGQAPTIEAAAAAGTLILVAEDNVINQDIMRRQLNLLGYAAEFTDDGKQALAAWRRTPYAMLLTDCHMPEMDGFELTQAIRKAEQEGEGHLPIVAITASVLETEVARCIEVGMDDYLAKPLEIPKLKAALRKWMPDAPVAAGAPAEDGEEDAQARAPAGAAAVDPAALVPLTGGDREVLKEILDDFIDPARSIAGEIEAAFAERSAAGVGAAAHKFKSAAQTIGANSLADLCLALESAGKAGNWEEIDALAPRLDGELRQVFDYIAAL
jgi:PAS domain S-box-containing protein